MIEPIVLAEEKGNKFVWLSIDEAEMDKGIITNQYLLTVKDKGVLMDPGGPLVFERVYNAMQKFIKPEDVEYIFLSHEDPDIVSGISLWLSYCPNAKILISDLWDRFLPHVGVDIKMNVIRIPIQGMQINLNGDDLRIIPAHFLHSVGNFHLYDPITKVYFSGDLGAAVFPKGSWYIIVDNFDEHKKYMEGFHKKYMANKKAIELWLKQIQGLDIRIIAPQHGAVIEGNNVRKFIDWIKSLDKIGIDLLEEELNTNT
ncbi:MBL fold metallo-hydrolase [Acidianus ambivalens]|uniref:MBL fold metallo-hydrolase n=1 Tax=Acidianus ambivalens TaxID=2283 RepID=A0A650CT34_ACIAM|nr:MBL fold metallo-hydrolase [Acidianus ambivalens]MQL55433.1 MBL fold metallo-hydrolase [Acidianus ambivalens]QGR20968.1 MBL fold metallo-hydrolase [Acidianus ambivalens]